VPERPALAPNIQLVGEMQETGFEDRQWLIQRGGRFMQVTELLYRVAEQANGERTLEEIAAGVTESTDWMVSSDNVRQLIQLKLIPAGLIAPEGGSSLPHEEGRTPSPLALNMRMKTIGPRVIDPITRVLQFLYAPPFSFPSL
jgi:putative peptide zinc metalloprotease protein